MMKYNCLLTETNIYVLHLWILVALSRHEIVLQTLFRVEADTGGPRIVLFLRTQVTVLLRKPYYSGTDLVLK